MDHYAASAREPMELLKALKARVFAPFCFALSENCIALPPGSGREWPASPASAVLFLQVKCYDKERTFKGHNRRYVTFAICQIEKNSIISPLEDGVAFVPDP